MLASQQQFTYGGSSWEWKGVVSPSRYSEYFVTCKVQGKIQRNFNSENGNKFVVHKKDGSKRYFQQSKRCLYYFTVRDYNIKKLKIKKTDENHNTIFNTVEQMKKVY